MLMQTLLKKIPFFQAFDEEELNTIGETPAFFQSHPKGSFLIREGSRETDLLLLVQGHVSVFKGATTDTPLATLGPGDVIGEMAFLTRNPRFTNVIALEEVIAFRMDGQILAQLPLPLHLKVKDQLIHVLIRHLEETTRLLMRQQEINRTLVAAMEQR